MSAKGRIISEVEITSRRKEQARSFQGQRFQLAELAAEHPQGLINTALSLKNFRPVVEIRLDKILKAS